MNFEDLKNVERGTVLVDGYGKNRYFLGFNIAESRIIAEGVKNGGIYSLAEHEIKNWKIKKKEQLMTFEDCKNLERGTILFDIYGSDRYFLGFSTEGDKIITETCFDNVIYAWSENEIKGWKIKKKTKSVKLYPYLTGSGVLVYAKHPEFSNDKPLTNLKYNDDGTIDAEIEE